MQIIETIKAIEARAAIINLSLLRLCRIAQVDYGTVHRWKKGSVAPNLAVYERNTGNLLCALENQEKRILSSLQGAADPEPPPEQEEEEPALLAHIRQAAAE